jgi:hypothetical protein
MTNFYRSEVESMKRNRGVRIVKILVIAALAIPLFGLLLMSLWNWLMPNIFDLRPVTFAQALGLFFLSRILFGGFGGDGGRRHSHRRMMERWERMTPEERERFRAGITGLQPSGE